MLEQLNAPRVVTDNRQWTRVAVPIFVLYVAVAIVVSPDLFLSNLRRCATSSLFWIVFVGIVIAPITAVIQDFRAPWTRLRRLFWSNGRRVATTFSLLVIGFAAFWTLKYHIPTMVPFYADPLLADIDDAIHFGPPWRLAHAVIPDGWMAAMVAMYFPAWLLQFYGGMTLAATHPVASVRRRYWICFTATYGGLGTLLAIAASSGGPIFYNELVGVDRFGQLPDRLRAYEASTPIFAVADRLYSSYTSGAISIIAGISAMPSIHVAVATLNALFSPASTGGPELSDGALSSSPCSSRCISDGTTPLMAMSPSPSC